MQPGQQGSSPKPSPSEAHSWSEQLGKLDESTEEPSSTSKDVHVADDFFFLLLSCAEVGLHLVLPISSFVCSHSGKQFP